MVSELPSRVATEQKAHECWQMSVSMMCETIGIPSPSRSLAIAS
jgi:hypothetical protein